MSQLTIHVLDTAAGMRYCLYRVGHDSALASGTTRADGRADAPLLAGADFRTGVYELHFDVDAYFRTRGVDLPQPPFLDTVTLRFGVADPGAHYHIPLLVSPWSYSTYRGS